MNDDEMRRVREWLDRSEVHERERRQSVRKEVQTIAEREAAIDTAVRVALLGVIPSVAWLIVASFYSDWSRAFLVIFGMLCFFVPFLPVLVAAGFFGGLFAHWWFADSNVPVRWIAVALPLLVDAVLFGWVVVISR